MKPKCPTVLDKLVPGSPYLPGKMYAFLVPPCQKTFLKTTEHYWRKTILSRGCRGKMFNERHNTVSTAPYTLG